VALPFRLPSCGCNRQRGRFGLGVAARLGEELGNHIQVLPCGKLQAHGQAVVGERLAGIAPDQAGDCVFAGGIRHLHIERLAAAIQQGDLRRVRERTGRAGGIGTGLQVGGQAQRLGEAGSGCAIVQRYETQCWMILIYRR
jgi:hypothetical protein